MRPRTRALTSQRKWQDDTRVTGTCGSPGDGSVTGVCLFIGHAVTPSPCCRSWRERGRLPPHLEEGDARTPTRPCRGSWSRWASVSSGQSPTARVCGGPGAPHSVSLCLLFCTVPTPLAPSCSLLPSHSNCVCKRIGTCHHFNPLLRKSRPIRIREPEQKAWRSLSLHEPGSQLGALGTCSSI